MRPALLLASLLLFIPGPATAGVPHEPRSGAGASSTGDVDVWGLGDVVPASCATDGAPVDCFIDQCGPTIGTRFVRLTLLDPSPGDVVALTVVTLDSSVLVLATADDPVAERPVRMVRECPEVLAIVVGLHVDGEVAYTIQY